jgi:hypothetical protein
MELADTGLIGMYIADANALAEMADILGRKQDTEGLRGSAQKYSEKLATLWNPAAGIFLDKICTRENSINALLRRVSIQCFPKLQHLTKLTKCRTSIFSIPMNLVETGSFLRLRETILPSRIRTIGVGVSGVQ